MKNHFAWVLAVAFCTSAAADDPARFITDSATAAMLVRTEAFHAAPMVAQAEADGHLLIVGAEGAQWLMLASDLDVRYMQPTHRVFVGSYDSPQNFAEQVKQVGAVTDTIAGRPAVWVDGRVCVIAFSPQLFGGIGPVNRQQAAQWAEDVVQEEKPGSQYLQSVLRSAESSDDVLVLAIELRDLFRAQEIESALQRSGLFPAETLDAATEAFNSVRGVTVRVHVDTQASARLQIDFDADATILHPQAKPILLAALNAAGAQIADMNQWTAINGPRSIGIEGPLSPEGLHHVTTILELDSRPIDQALGTQRRGTEPAERDAPRGDTAPPAGTATIPPTVQPPVPPPPAVAPPAAIPPVVTRADTDSASELRRRAVATHRYYSRIDRMIDTLKRGSQGGLGNVALWMERDADLIGRMSTRNVDSELVGFGQTLSYEMRTMVGMLSGLNRQVAAKLAEGMPQIRAGALPTGRTVNYGGVFLRRYAPFYSANMDVGAAARAQQEAQQIAAAGSSQIQQMAQQQIREFESLGDRLEQRYGITFD